MTPILLGTRKSRALRVLWLLEELGIPYEHRPVGPRSDEARSANPSGKIPALLVEGAAITDSTAILHFLADHHGAFAARPGTVARANQDAATQFALDELDSVLWTAARHSFVLPEAMRVPAIKDSLKWEFGRSVERLGERLSSQDHAGGADFSLCDIVTAHCLRWAGSAGFPVEHPAAVAYLDRVTARPAFLRAVERD